MGISSKLPDLKREAQIEAQKPERIKNDKMKGYLSRLEDDRRGLKSFI